MSNPMNVGFATVTVQPSFKGFQAAVSKETGSVFPAAGRAGGASFGRAIAEGFKDSSSDLKTEAKKLEDSLFKAQDALKKSKAANKTATDAEAKANGDLRVAELKLAEARENSNTKASALAKAEEDLAEKQRKAADASAKATAAQSDLKTSSEKLVAAETSLKTATDKANQELAQSPAEAAKAKKGLKGLRDQTDNTKAGLSKLGDYMKGAFVGAIAAVSFGAIIGGMKDVISLAGDYQQSVGAVDSVFKDQSGKMHAKAGTAAVDVGLDKNAYNELGSVLGSQLKNAGTPMDQLSEKTSNLITLGADLSSMFGGTTKEAIEAVSSALKGEMDPIERYGITLNESALQAEALSKGLIKPIVDADKVSDASIKMQVAQKKYNEVVAKHGKDSMESAKAQVTLNSAQRAFDKATEGKIPKLEGEAKALAVQSALYAQSADAQGNFAKESGTLQGQQSRLNAEVANMKIAAGTAFIPAMTSIVSAIRTTVIPALQNMGQWIKDNQSWLKPLAVTIGVTAGAFLLFSGVSAIIGGITSAIGLLKGGFAALNVVMKANLIGIIVTAVIGLVAGFIYLWNNVEGFRNFFIGAWDGIKNAVMGAWNGFIKPAFDAIVGFVRDTLVPLFVNFYNGVILPVWSGIQGAIAGAVGFITDSVNNVVGFFRNVVAPVFVWLYQNIIMPIWTAIKVVIAVVATAVTLYVMGWVWVFKNVLAPVFKWLYGSVILPIWNGIKTAISVVIMAVKGYINLWVSLFKNVLAPVFTWIYNTIIKPVFNGIMSTISTVWTAIKGTFQSIVNFIRNTLSLAFTWLRDTVIKPVWNGIKTAISTVWTGIKTTFQNIIDFIRGTLSAAFTWLRDTIIKPIFNGIKDTISNVWNNGIKPIFSALGNFIKDNVAPAFKKGVDAISGFWENLKKIAATPINFVIDEVYNNGIRKVFNDIAGKIGLGDLKLPEGVPIPAFAKGGQMKSGWKLVGEEGPELINTAPGYVYTAKETKQMLAGQAQAPLGSLPMFNRNEKSSPLPIGGWMDNLGSFVGDVGRNIGNAKNWVLGQLAEGAKALLNPVRNIITNALPANGFPGAARQISLNAIDGIFDWTKKKDQSAPAAGEFAGSYDGPRGSFFRPSAGRYTSMFGPRGGGFHAGIDIANGEGSPTFAALNGIVKRVGWGGGLPGRTGNGIVLDHGNGFQTYYGHNPTNGVVVKPGQQVKAGQHIGAQGSTGNVTGPHLHFETLLNGRPVNPLNYLGGRVRGGGSSAGAKLYDNGGWLPPSSGIQQVQNLTRKPEPVLTSGQWDSISSLALSKTVGGNTINVTVPNPGATGPQIADAIYHQARVQSRGGR
ncbi:peptidoglycan DD-metalloendopeptidase family protein [Paeniglutamicibacter sp. NPDC012692]|uniref:peptidoglycan DD-metalloendopeptidase family protein n=1 Tax=Paeniglutamicibacter sp. NPDC012692 TaxID=3364388 RepID=UPI0036A72811